MLALEVGSFEKNTAKEAFEQTLEVIASLAVQLQNMGCAVGLVTNGVPIVGFNDHPADPHFEPTRENAHTLHHGDTILIDLWARRANPAGVYYDITWTGCCSAQPTDKVQQVFEAVTGARDHALAFINDAVKAERNPKGFEADDAARQYLDQAGWGERFVHRLGHSIGYEIHGNGANLDNFETHDDRPLVAGTCFSIEPGVYLPEFGVRSEIDCWVSAEGAQATGRVQREIVRIQV